jgi:hypothetical protein
MRRTLSLLLCSTLLTSACATTSASRFPSSAPATTPRVDPALLGSYVKQLPIGSRVRVSLASGGRLTGTLMKADEQELVIQPRTRIPEQPVAIALDRIVSVEFDSNGGAGKTVAIGIAAGVGGALAFFLVMAAIFAGS